MLLEMSFNHLDSNGVSNILHWELSYRSVYLFIFIIILVE